MKKYRVELEISKIAYGYVRAKNRQEAEDKAFCWDNIEEEMTDSEEIENVEILEEAG
jgi:translation elongation factor EF-1beta